MSVPSPSSIAHRESISRLLTPLRRVRPAFAYYKLAAHRIPTLWTLYRGLQRHAERDNVKWRIRTLFKEKRHTIQAHIAREQLKQGYKWLDMFIRAKQGDTYLKAVLDRYDRMIANKRERREFGRLVREAVEEQARLRTRTIFKGSFIRPSVYNRLLPRLVPQPVSISCIINKRRLRREERYHRGVEVMKWIEDLKMESTFEKGLLRSGQQVEPVFSNSLGEWLRPLKEKLNIIRKANDNDYRRLYSDYPPALLLRGVRARREKIQYKTRQHARERSGELYPTTLKRMRKGPPAYILEKMSREERRMDKIARGPSEVGYAAVVKMKLGMRLKDPDAWKLEDGREEDWESLDRMEEQLRAENMRRRAASSEEMNEEKELVRI